MTMTCDNGRPASAPTDLDAQLLRLDAVVHELSAPPADRDAVLWAAHEFATCARMLLSARDHGAAEDLGDVLDCARSAMATLTIARRQDPPATTGWHTTGSRTAS